MEQRRRRSGLMDPTGKRATAAPSTRVESA